MGGRAAGFLSGLLCAAAVVLVLTMLCVPVQAAEAWDGVQSDTDAALWDLLPDDTRALLAQIGVAGTDAAGFAALTPGRVLQLLLTLAESGGAEAVRTGASLLGVLLLMALVGCVMDGGTAQTPITLTGTLLCAVLLLRPLSALMQAVTEALTASCAFQMSFVPIFASILTVSGQAVTAGKYTALTVAAAQTGSVLTRAVVLPLLKMSAALSVTGAAAPTVRVDGLGALIQKGLTNLLGLLMTVFLAVLSLQGVTGAAADSLTDKAAQFVLSSAVPVVGAALSQAYASARGYLQGIKSGAGAFGILAACALLLPQVVELLVWRLVLALCAEAGTVLGQAPLAELIRRFHAALGVLLGVLLCGGLMTVVSVGVMLMIRAG